MKRKWDQKSLKKCSSKVFLSIEMQFIIKLYYIHELKSELRLTWTRLGTGPKPCGWKLKGGNSAGGGERRSASLWGPGNGRKVNGDAGPTPMGADGAVNDDDDDDGWGWGGGGGGGTRKRAGSCG